jgi:hypothetical protein
LWRSWPFIGDFLAQAVDGAEAPGPKMIRCPSSDGTCNRAFICSGILAAGLWPPLRSTSRPNSRPCINGVHSGICW